MALYTAKHKFLVVDDDDATRLLIAEILGYNNIEIVEAANSTQALKLFNLHGAKFDLALIDILLPGFDGCRLLRQIHGINPHFTAIAISALDPAKLKREYDTKHFAAIITKPFSMDALLNAVDPYLKVASTSKC